MLCNETIVFTQSVLPNTADAPAPKAKTSSTSKATKAAPAPEPAADESDADEAAGDETDSDADAGFAPGEWAGSVQADAVGNGPDTHPIKGNADSRLDHVHRQQSLRPHDGRGLVRHRRQRRGRRRFQKPADERDTESEES